MISRYQKATSQNIVYQGSNAVLGDASIQTPANFGKFIQNNSGTLTYTSLPLPDVNTQTADKDNYTVVFDYTNKIYKLVYIKIPYNALQDVNIRWMFLPSATTTTFSGSTLTKISAMSLRGTSYDNKYY